MKRPIDGCRFFFDFSQLGYSYPQAFQTPHRRFRPVLLSRKLFQNISSAPCFGKAEGKVLNPNVLVGSTIHPEPNFRSFVAGKD
jgi:hypothetical protein